MKRIHFFLTTFLFVQLFAFAQTPQLIKDINPGAASSEIDGLTQVGNSIFFFANDGTSNGYELWRTEGTDAGTQMIQNVNNSTTGGAPVFSNPFSNLIVKGGEAFWLSLETTSVASEYRLSLWKAGPSSNATLVKEILVDNFRPYELVLDINEFYWIQGTEAIWRSDGTEAGTIPIVESTNELLDKFLDLELIGANIYFTRQTVDPNNAFNNRIDTYKIYRSGDFAFSRNAVGNTPITCGLYEVELERFGIREGYVIPGSAACNYTSYLYSEELGTFSETSTPISGSGIISPYRYGNDIYYFAYADQLGSEYELKKFSNGQTTTLKNVGSHVGEFVEIPGLNQRLLFLAGDALWKTSGTAAGTQILKSFDQIVFPTEFQRGNYFNRFFYFFVAIENGVTGFWVTDGTTARTTKVVDFPSTSPNAFDSYHVSDLIVINDLIVFSGDDGQRGTELWKIDFDPAPPAFPCNNNMLVNPGFENGLNGWTIVDGATLSSDAFSDSNAAAINKTGDRILQIFPAQEGEEFTASGLAKSSGLTSSGQCQISFLSSIWQPILKRASGFGVSGEYEPFSHSLTAPANTAWVEVSYFMYFDQNSFLIDDVCFSKVGGTTPNCTISATVSNLFCEDAGTSGDPSDDEYVFDLEVSSTNGGPTYDFIVPSLNINIPRVYGTMQVDGSKISDGVKTIILRDSSVPNCETTINITPPATCSNDPGSETGCGIDRSISDFTGIPSNRIVRATENTDGTITANVSDFSFTNGLSLRGFETDEAGVFQNQSTEGIVPTGFSPIEGGYYITQVNGANFIANFYDYNGAQTMQRTISIPATFSSASLGLKKLDDGYMISGIVTSVDFPGKFLKYANKVDNQFNSIWAFTYTDDVFGGSNYRHLQVSEDGGHYFLRSDVNSYTLIKTNNVGTILWTQGQTASGTITFSDISESPDGQSVYTAQLSAPQSQPFQTARFFKLNANTGQQVWTRTGTSPKSVYSPSIIGLNFGAIIAYTEGAPIGNTTPVFNYDRINVNGGTIWTRTKENVTLTGNMQTADGGFLFSGTNNFGVPYLMKTTSNGNLTPACQSTSGPAELTIIGSPCPTNFPQKGGTVSVDFTVKNTGGTASSGETIYLYRSVTCRACGPANLGSVNVPPLQPNEEVTLTVTGENDRDIPEFYVSTGQAVPTTYFGYFLSNERSQFPRNLKDIDYYCKKFDSDISIEIDPITPEYDASGEITFRLIARNLGNQDAKNVAVYFLEDVSFFSVFIGNVITGTNADLQPTNSGAQWVIPNISEGAEVTSDFTFKILNTPQYATVPDDLTITANISSGHNLNTNTSNDSDSFTFVKMGTPPTGDGNLVLTATGDPTIQQWSNGTALFEVTNQSGETFENVQVTFDFDSNIRLMGANQYTSSAGTTLEQSWTRNPVWNVGTIGAGSAKTISLNVYSITNSPMEIYAQISQATGQDVTSTPGNGTPPTVNEDDEVLWQINGGTPPTGQSDLTISNLNLNATSVQSGEVLTYNFDVANIGNNAISGNFSIKSYISTDNSLSANDIQDGIITTGNFGAGNSSTDVPGGATIPNNLPEGNYYLIVKVDADDQVVESNENNNVLSAQFSIDNGNANPTPPCPGNLLTNPGFENGIDNWSFVDPGSVEITSDANSGNAAMIIFGNDAVALEQALPAEPGSIYRLTFWGKKTGSSQSSGLVNGVPNGRGQALPVDESSEFREYSGEARMSITPASDNLQVLFAKAAGNGTFTVDDVCLQNLGSPGMGVDLALSYQSLNGPAPAQWSFFSTTLTLQNSGTENATGIEVDLKRPDEAIYKGGDEYNASQGTFQHWGDEIWRVGDLAPGNSVSITINYFRLSANGFTNFAQVRAVDQSDTDSTPGNGTCCTGNEDDEAVLQIGNSARGVNNRSAIAENLGNEVFAIVGTNPNPTTGRFNVEVYSNENQTSEMTIVNILGIPIFRKEVNLTEGHNTIPIELENGGAGMMVVKMTPFHPYLRQIRVMKVRD